MNIHRAKKYLLQIKQNPKADWTATDIKALCKAFGIHFRQQKSSHAVLTNAEGLHLMIPMHNPIHPISTKRFVKFIEKSVHSLF